MVKRQLDVQWLGRQPFETVWAMQHDRVAAIANNQAPDTLLLLEHDPVMTLGRRRGAKENLLDPGGIPVVEIERGGDVTYHAPGQLVGYALLALGEGERDLHLFLRNLEEAVIRGLADFGLEAGRREGQTGVWVKDQKVASVGVAVRRWVTYHGFALNVTTEMAPFQQMNPCGLSASVMARTVDLGLEAGVLDLARAIARHFPVVFNREAAVLSDGTEWPSAARQETAHGR